jgi:hypothetical protein
MNMGDVQMASHRRSIRSLISIAIILCLILTMNPAFVSAIQMESYAYRAQSMDRPDLISYDLAKSTRSDRGTRFASMHGMIWRMKTRSSSRI